MQSFQMPDPAKAFRTNLKEQAKLAETGALASAVAESVFPTPLSAAAKAYNPAERVSLVGPLEETKTSNPVTSSSSSSSSPNLPTATKNYTPAEISVLEKQLILCPKCGEIKHRGLRHRGRARRKGKRECMICGHGWKEEDPGALKKHKEAVQKLYAPQHAKNGGYKKSRKKKRRKSRRKTRRKTRRKSHKKRKSRRKSRRKH